VLRIMYRLHQAGRGEDPAVDIMRDPHLVITFAAWLAVTLSIIV
jgi:hypothetical protein